MTTCLTYMQLLPVPGRDREFQLTATCNLRRCRGSPSRLPLAKAGGWTVGQVVPTGWARREEATVPRLLVTESSQPYAFGFHRRSRVCLKYLYRGCTARRTAIWSCSMSYQWTPSKHFSDAGAFRHLRAEFDARFFISELKQGFQSLCATPHFESVAPRTWLTAFFFGSVCAYAMGSAGWWSS